VLLIIFFCGCHFRNISWSAIICHIMNTDSVDFKCQYTLGTRHLATKRIHFAHIKEGIMATWPTWVTSAGVFGLNHMTEIWPSALQRNAKYEISSRPEFKTVPYFVVEMCPRPCTSVLTNFDHLRQLRQVFSSYSLELYSTKY